jgi:uncharacterized protein (TIGR00251 family)
VIELVEHPDGIILPVRAQAGARDNAIRGLQDGALKVAVTQVAEKGKANKAVTDVLCKSLSLKRSQVTLITGDSSSQKRFLVRGIQAEDLAERIRRLLPP